MQEYIEFAMRHEILVLAWIGLATAVIASAVKAKLSPVKQVEHQAAVALINKQDAVVVDVRTQEEFPNWLKPAFSRYICYVAVYHSGVPVTYLSLKNVNLILQ